MITKDFNSLIDIVKAFPTEEHCIAHLEQLRWNGIVVSPFDLSSKVYKCKGNKYRCKNTGKYFNVRTNTLFDNTKIELIKWFMAIWLVTSHKKGISSLQLGRDIDVTQKTAWFMLQRIRKCFGCENNSELNNEVEIDETYIGGKNKNRHADKKVENSQGRSVKDKTPILGMVERKGKIVARKIETTSVAHITPEVVKTVKNAMVYTDEWVGYNMVRIMVGTLLRIQQGKIAPDEIPSIIEKKNRKYSGPTAQACGLYLNRVNYENDNSSQKRSER